MRFDYNGAVAEIGRWLVAVGAVLLAVGVLFLLLGRTPLPLGRLPGDLTYRGKHTTFFFPLTTSILLSIFLTLLFYLMGRFRR